METPRIVQKFGEVTNQKLYQVQGGAHWYSTPQKAMDEHSKLVKFSLSGGFKGRK